MQNTKTFEIYYQLPSRKTVRTEDSISIIETLLKMKLYPKNVKPPEKEPIFLQLPRKPSKIPKQSVHKVWKT